MSSPPSSLALRLACTLLLVAPGGCATAASSATTPRPPQEAAPAAPAEPGASLLDLAGWQVATGEHRVHTVAWRPLGGGEPPRNRDFDIEVIVLRDGQPRPVERLDVRGWMPDHGHGLVQAPSVRETGPGRYRVEGLLLHMRGHWQVHMTLLHDGRHETVTYDLEL